MTLKLLLDWAQIIYSMKNIKIYPKDWLQLHPYKQSDPTDSYYTNIANRIYGMLEETRLAYSFEKDEVKQISIRMAALFRRCDFRSEYLALIHHGTQSLIR